MSHAGNLYPATPVNVPASVTQPSPAFKKEVSTVMASIIFFFIVYILLFILSLALVVGCFYGGLALITGIRHWIGILAGAGLMGLGVMVFIFLVKFLFAVNKADRSNAVEISEAEQPELFAFIRQVTIDTQTPFPKRIYLTPDVNASVFYDSGFWSMFLPVKKNLQIGLGLVNSVNISEFKAVMAHEFGHFSQRSMKLGSFVYNVNKVIYNMLYENSGYANFLGNWASVSDVFAIFANLTAKIAQGIQWILRQVYKVVNKNYLGLSRQMEFHADAVAASVSGSHSLITALHRIELASAGYNIALQKCDDLFKEKKVSDNIFQNHQSVLRHLANQFSLVEENGLPVVTDEFINSNNTTRVNFKDQWASHPTTEDRKQHLAALAIPAETVTEPAWKLFRDKDMLQAALTKKVYEHIQLDKDITTIDAQVFESRLKQDEQKFELPKAYHGFYDGRQVEVINDEELVSISDNNSSESFEELFNTTNASLPKKIQSAAGDVEVLRAIATKNIDVKSFDFDGVKYKATGASTIADQLENEKDQLKQQLISLDKRAIAFFMKKAADRGNEQADALRKDYSDYFALRKKADHYLEIVNSMLQQLSPIYSGQTIPVEQINSMIATHKAEGERLFKKYLQEWIDTGLYEDDAMGKEKTVAFIGSNYEYFSGTSFFDNELHELNALCNGSWTSVNTLLFMKFKRILEMQLALLK